MEKKGRLAAGVGTGVNLQLQIRLDRQTNGAWGLWREPRRHPPQPAVEDRRLFCQPQRPVPDAMMLMQCIVRTNASRLCAVPSIKGFDQTGLSHEGSYVDSSPNGSHLRSLYMVKQWLNL